MRQQENIKMTLANANDIESNTCQRKYYKKTTLIKVKESKSDNCEHENDTCESEGAQKRQLGKITEIKVQMQPK